MNLHRLIASLAACASCTWVAANPALVPIEWNASGHFAHQAEVPAGKFVEVCGRLPAGTKVQWRFDASGPLNFNIHFHEGEKVRYPAKQDGTARASGTLDAAASQDYCWMWTNKSQAPADLRLDLGR